jgi:uncharacterized protein YuzE
LRIRHDKESGALYIRVRDGRYDHTEDFSERADVYLDVDVEGNVLGLEALSFDDLAIAVEEQGGNLDLPEPPAGVRGESNAQSPAQSSAQQASEVAYSAAQQAAEMAGHSATQAAEAADQVAGGALENDEDKAHPESGARSSRSRR